MENLMRLLAPRSEAALTFRLFVAVGIIALANCAFVYAIGLSDEFITFYSILHAVVVGGPFAVFVLFVMSYQVKLQRELSVLSRKDGLTGLNNRRTFLEYAQRCQKSVRAGALLLIDADNFKQINDTYGHQAGDQCLKSIARTLTLNIRHDDILGRIGGEEFAIFLRDTTSDQACRIAERLTRPISFMPSSEARGLELRVTLSVGAAMFEQDQPLDGLLAKADKALYRAKAEGRARLVVWNEPQKVTAMTA